MTTSVETAATLLLALTALVLIGCADRVRLDEYAQTERREQTHLATFDDLDFNVFSGEKWDELDKSHSAGITVHWRDGRTTTGIEAHIADLKAMFVYAPDTRINEHPIRIASGEWTAVTGILEGTFSQPMPIGDGRTIPATGKPFKLSMVTIGRWEDGTMAEEWLYWDNQTFMREIGVAQ